MSQLAIAFAASLLLHGVWLWRAPAPQVRALAAVQEPMFWMAPPATVRAAKAGGANQPRPGRAPAPSAGPSAEWHSMGELVSQGNRPPEYPPEAMEREWEGTVKVKVEFDDEGRADAVGLESSSGHRILDEAALEAARTWRYTSRGRRIVVVPVAFKLEDES